MATSRFIAAFAAAVALAACSSHQSSPMPAVPGQSPVQSMGQSAMQPDVACRHEGAVRVTPCRVEFTSSNQGPVTVTLRTPHGAKGSVVEHDNCTGIATITQQSNNTWQVTAGSTSGTCHARFNYSNNGQLVGYAVLRIRNQV